MLPRFQYCHAALSFCHYPCMAHHPCLLGWFSEFVTYLSPYHQPAWAHFIENQDRRWARPIRSRRGPERGLVVDWLNWHQMREEWTCVRGCRVGLISNSESRKFRAHNLYICTYFDIFLIVRKKLGIPRNTHASTWLRPWIITKYLRMIYGFAILCQACQLPATHPHSSQETSNLQQSYKSWDRDQAIKKVSMHKSKIFL